MRTKPMKRIYYTYRRKSDGHLYQVSYTTSIELFKSPTFIEMAMNDFWETVFVSGSEFKANNYYDKYQIYKT